MAIFRLISSSNNRSDTHTSPFLVASCGQLGASFAIQLLQIDQMTSNIATCVIEECAHLRQQRAVALELGYRVLLDRLMSPQYLNGSFILL